MRQGNGTRNVELATLWAVYPEQLGGCRHATVVETVILWLIGGLDCQTTASRGSTQRAAAAGTCRPQHLSPGGVAGSGTGCCKPGELLECPAHHSESAHTAPSSARWGGTPCGQGAAVEGHRPTPSGVRAVGR